MPFRPSELMSNKIALLMFAATILLASTALMTIPQASALTQSNVMRYISTASYGNSLVCGDHKCAPGEHNQWFNAVWQTQKVNSGKVGTAPHGEDVMSKLAGPEKNADYKWVTPINQQTTIKGYK
jgi:hypothetical protein